MEQDCHYGGKPLNEAMKIFRLLVACALSLGLPRALLGAGSPLEVGAEAPRTTVTIDTGEKLDLGAAYGRGPILVYFYPKSFTRGCTAQACNLRDNFDAVRAAGITVLGVSRDPVETQARFREEEALPFHLVADVDGELGKRFGVDTYGGAAYQRQTFLVVDGRIAWRDLEAKPGSQAADAVAALNAVRGIDID